MDPLSIIASIAGIATAGTSLSKAIYHFISSTRGASREMVEIARNISDLSCILSELRRVLQESADLCSRKLLRRIKSAMRRISAIHDDIYILMDSSKGFQTFCWSLKRSEVQYKLTLIESHKTAIHLMLNILILAATTRKQAQCEVSQTTSTTESKQKEPESEIPLLRQQSENIAYAACHCLVDISENQAFNPSYTFKHSKADFESDNDDHEGQIQIGDHMPSDSTDRWLFELAFENYSKISQVPESHDQHIGRQSEVPDSDGGGVAIRNPSELQRVIHEPGASVALVDTLLTDWTSLSKEEITGKAISKSGTEHLKRSVSKNAMKDVPGIHLRDSIGREFTFPYHRVQKWEGMEKQMKRTFRCKSDILGQFVQNGHYALIGTKSYGISPAEWESIVEPGLHVQMSMLSNREHMVSAARKKSKALVRNREKVPAKTKG